MAKPKTKPEFTFTKWGGSGEPQRYDELLVRKIVREDQLSPWLCRVQENRLYPGQWRITHAHERIYEELRYLQFESKEHAAKFVFALETTLITIEHGKPLPVDVTDYFNRRAQAALQELRELRGRITYVQMERRQLLALGRDYGLESATYLSEDADSHKSLRDLLKFRIYVKDQEVPFFSEAALYELIGKEDARTVLALLRKVITHIDPVLAEEI